MSDPAVLGLEVLNEVKTALGDDYKSLTDEQRLSIRETATMAMEKEIALKTETEPAKIADLKLQLEAIESTVTDWKVWGVLGVEEAFWKGVQKVAATIGSFLSAFALEALKRLVPGI